MTGAGVSTTTDWMADSVTLVLVAVTIPGTPVAPAAPVAPEGPVAPLAPFVPSAPLLPLDPLCPRSFFTTLGLIWPTLVMR